MSIINFQLATFSDLFESWAGEPLDSCSELGANGSNRKYFRLKGSTKQCIAAYNADVRENDAFIYYSQAFQERGLPVPELFAVSSDHCRYLQQDLGDTTLYSFLFEKRRKGGGFDAQMLAIYRQVLDDLIRFQTSGRDLDFSHAYPRSDFDRQSLAWDFQYFKYFFLKLAHIPFDEQLLEDDFATLTHYLLDTDCSYFIYRDFQTRNIMLLDHQSAEQQNNRSQFPLYYIDYQGGRRGAPYYDVASLLYSSKSDLSEPIRQELLHYYLDKFACSQVPLSESRFYAYALARILQALGAYGYRGYFERKSYFLQSIPFAVNNIRSLLQDHPLPIDVPHLQSVLLNLVEKDLSSLMGVASRPSTVSDHLTVTVTSFSYKKGLPDDASGNGGGFVFDCRALPNPGRYPEYQAYTGRDPQVVAFLTKEPAVWQFLENAQKLVAQSVEKYIERHFSSLCVSFGCTGGQHRSVFCAEQMAQAIQKSFPQCEVRLIHREQQ